LHYVLLTLLGIWTKIMLASAFDELALTDRDEPGACEPADIIPTFNHADFLPDAIASVLAQKHPADEIVVDGSTDDPAAVVATFRNVRLIRRGNGRLSAARNTSLRSCTSERCSKL
jgi:hypothetical protein